MPQAKDCLELIRQNLIDAGCDGPTTETCMRLAGEGRMRELLPALARHKTALLSTVRTAQKQIDCLDFLVYQIHKHEKKLTD